MSTVTISNATDLALGSHALAFTIGSEVLLPGAGKPEDGSDYFLLAVIDPTNTTTENEFDPLNEDNTVSFVGAYATSTTISLHGGAAADMVTLTYPATKTGNVALDLSGSISAMYSYAYHSTEMATTFSMEQPARTRSTAEWATTPYEATRGMTHSMAAPTPTR